MENRYIVVDSLNQKEITRLSDIEIRTILYMRDSDADREEFDRIFGIKKRDEMD